MALNQTGGAPQPRHHVLAHAAAAGWTSAEECLDFVKKLVNGLAIMCLGRETCAHVVCRRGSPRPTEPLASTIAQDAHDTDGVGAHRQFGEAAGHARPDSLDGEPRPRCRVRPGIGNLGFTQESAVDADRCLQRVRPRLPTRAPHLHPIFPNLRDFHVGEIEHDVRGEIA